MILLPYTKVCVETPYRASQERPREVLDLYLDHCLADAIKRRLNPYSSHRMLTAALDDDDHLQREIGIWLGYQYGETCAKVEFFCDMGFSEGMSRAWNHYTKVGLPCERKTLDPKLFKSILEMAG